MTLKKTLICTTAIVSLLPISIVDAVADSERGSLTVVGSRLNQTKSEIGTSVSVITAEDIEELGFDFAVDAIASAPGVTVNQNGPFGGFASIRIRGAASGQTLVLIDGVPVNDPSSPGGGYDFARLDTDAIERIEVLKGPQSTLWGTDAIGGVVSIITKEPEDGIGGSAFGEYGSFNTFRGGASIGTAGDAGDIRFAVTGTSSDGNSKADEDNGNPEDDGFESVTLSANGGLNLPNDIRLDANVLWSDSEADFDGFVFGAQGNVGDSDDVNETEELSGNVSLNVPLFDGRLQNQFLIGYSDIDRRNFSGGVPSFRSGGDRTLYRYQGTLTINTQNALAFGAEREETETQTAERTIDGAFALYEFKPIESLTLTGGIRIDDHDQFGSETTGRVAAAYAPTDQITLSASWGQGFKAPTLFQSTFICCGETEPNLNLQPETSEGFDIGIQFRTEDGRGQFEVTYFDQETEDQIAFGATGYENIEMVESKGVEVAGTYQVTDWFTVSANYAYIDAEDGTGTRLIRVPEHSGDVRLSFNPEGPFSGSVLVRSNGEELDPNGDLDSWTRVDLTGQYEVTENVELYARVENLFDEDYQQILGYGTPGLSGSVGIRLRY